MPPIAEGSMNRIDHRYGSAGLRRLGRLDRAGAVMGVLNDVNAPSREVDVAPFEAEGFTDAEAGEETEDGDRPIARRRESRFPHLRQNVDDFFVGVDGHP